MPGVLEDANMSVTLFNDTHNLIFNAAGYGFAQMISPALLRSIIVGLQEVSMRKNKVSLALPSRKEGHGCSSNLSAHKLIRDF